MNNRRPKPDQKRNPNSVDDPDTGDTQDTPGRGNPSKGDPSRGDPDRGGAYVVKNNLRTFGTAA